MTRKFVKFVFYRAEDIPYSPPSVTHSIRQIVPHPLPHVMLSYDSYLISEFLRPLVLITTSHKILKCYLLRLVLLVAWSLYLHSCLSIALWLYIKAYPSIFGTFKWYLILNMHWHESVWLSYWYDIFMWLCTVQHTICFEILRWENLIYNWSVILVSYNIRSQDICNCVNLERIHGWLW